MDLYLVSGAAGVVAFLTTVAVINTVTRPVPPGLNWPGVVLWYAGAVSPAGRARALHPLTWVIFALAMVAHGVAGVYKAARETRDEWVVW